MYARPNGSEFGVSGMLWKDSLIMYDRETGSLWSQVLGKAVAGDLAGQSLQELPSQLTTWGDWKERHPGTLALRVTGGRPNGAAYVDYHRDHNKIGIHGKRNPDDRLPGKTLIYGVQTGGGAAAVSLAEVQKQGLLQGAVGGQPVVVVAVGSQGATALTYSPVVDGRALTFESVDMEKIRDRETGTLWARESGEALEGELAGQALSTVSGKMVYWGIWIQMHPDTELLF